MKRQAIIYAGYAGLGAVLFGYLLSLIPTAWQRFGFSNTFSIVCLLALLFGILTAFYAWMAYLFKYRALTTISKSEDGVFLIPDSTSFSVPLRVNRVHIVRQFGEQFAINESASKFTLIRAANKYWITSDCTSFMGTQT
jgi:hypothetical protein